MRSIGRATQPELIQRTLAASLSDDVKSQDVFNILGGLRAHRAGVEALFDFVVEKWDVFFEKFPPTLSLLGNVVALSTVGFSKKEQLDKINAFYDTKDQTGYVANLNQAKDTVQSKVSWVERDQKDVADWLKSNGYLA